MTPEKGEKEEKEKEVSSSSDPVAVERIDRSGSSSESVAVNGRSSSSESSDAGGEIRSSEVFGIEAADASKHSDDFSSTGGVDGSSVITEGSLSRAKTMPGGTSTSSNVVSTSNELKLERSNTERRRHSTILGGQTAQIFDDKISARKKLKMLNRIATVKDDGTVEFEVPGDVRPEGLDFGTEDVCNEAADEEPLDSTDLQYIPPLQIVILIVGTRGDVQPFVAIGKRLQDYGHRVRLATHANFKEFVLTAGLEFYPLGGDPKVLAECSKGCK